MKNQINTSSVLLMSALLLLFGMQSLFSSLYFNATFDEGTHLTSGYSYLTTGEVILNKQHPPLIKTLAALPLLLIEPQIDTKALQESQTTPNEWGYAFSFLYGNDADQLLFASRLVIILLSLILGTYVFIWSHALYGQFAAFLSLLLFSFSPNLIAHSHLITMDLGVTLFGTAAFYHLWKFQRARHPVHFLAFLLTIGCALCSKFSALMLLPLCCFFLIFPQTENNNSSYIKRAFQLLFLLISIVALTWICYFGSPPSMYLDGVLSVQRDHVAHYPAYLFGDFQMGGYWYYFLAAFIVKTPLLTIALLITAAASFFCFNGKLQKKELYLLLPILFWIVVTSALADNYGLRYILPIYPLLFIFAGRICNLELALFKRKATYGVFSIYFLITSACIFPNYLSYFNEGTGGIEYGHLLLDDSNIDWGQDLKRVPDLLSQLKIEEKVKILYERPVPPSYYGIHWEPVSKSDWLTAPSPGIYIMGTHV